jgi:ABC-2 type transport system permease protein
VGGVIVFGFIASWLFGREYSDRTLKDLFVLPVRRSILVVSKFLACVAWSAVVAVAVTVVSLVIGLLLHLPGWSWSLFVSSCLHIANTAILAVLLCPPVFFVASAGRGYLAALGFVILTVVFAQIIGALGFGAYVPWAVPALYSGLGSETGGSLNTASYAIVLLTGVAGLVATILWWNHADQTR